MIVLDQDEPDRKGNWWQGPVECGICGHRWVGVVELDYSWSDPFVPFECPKCSSMTGRPA